MKIRKEWLKQRWVPYTIATCSAVLLYLFFTNLNHINSGIGMFFSYLSPVIYGIIIAYVINPLVETFEEHVFYKVKKYSHRRLYAVIASTIVLIIFFIILLVALIPQIADSVMNLITNFKTYATGLQDLIIQASQSLGNSNINVSSIAHAGNNALNSLTKMITGHTGNIISTSFNIGTGIFNGVISCILALYFLLDARRIQNNLRKIFKGLMDIHVYHKATSFWRRCNRILIRYIIFDLLDGLIVGVLNFIFFLIVGWPYSVLISVVVGVTNLAPTFGPIVGCVIGAFILVLINPWYALWFILFTIALQTLDGYFIKPKLFGDSLGVPAIWVLVFIIVGGRMFGVWGIMLAIPCAAIINYIYEDVFLQRMEKRASLNAKTPH